MKKIIFAALCFSSAMLNLNAQQVTLQCSFVLDLSDSCSVSIDHNYIGNPVFISSPLHEREAIIKFSVNEPRFVNFNFDNQTTEIYVEPGKDLQLQIGTDSLHKSIAFSGDLASENVSFRNFKNKFAKSYSDTLIRNAALENPIDAFEIEIYKQRKLQNGFITTDSLFSSCSENFKTLIKSIITYNYLYQLQSYPILVANANKEVLQVSPLPDIMIENISDATAQHDELLNIDQYRNFVHYYVTYQTSKLNNFNKFTDYSVSCERKCAFAFIHLKDKTLNWYIAKYLSDEYKRISPSVVKQVFTKLEGNYKNTELTNCIRVQMNARMLEKEDKTVASKKTATDKPAGSGPRIKDLDENYFTLEDFKGKVVYIDFWASWCGPCRQQFPFSKALHEKFSKKELKEIEFLYISIDSNEETWRNAVKQNGLEGKNGIVPGDWNSEICRYFKINSIPRYMIMNKKGEVVDFNAKRPADPVVYDDLIKLIKQ
ncbi:MAG: TlpA family protein disulfide reductase [Bacteroidetes bacterium]|nr:TlpA family protein disulfide reductase [Bacteroidota bacterium]